MRIRTLVSAGVVAFIVGLLVAPAAQATSYKTGWIKIFGHSTSCTVQRGSINVDTHKSGSQSVNREGCVATNDPVAVPTGRLGAATQIYRPSHDHFCSYNRLKYNDSGPASSVTVTASLVVSSYCPATGTYAGFSSGMRISDAGDSYVKSQYTFNYTFQ